MVMFEKKENEKQTEECVIRIKVEPNQLDTFCNQITYFKGKVGEVASIKAH